MSDHRQFRERGAAEIAAQGRDDDLAALTRAWFLASYRHNYSYHFDWLGRPLIQYPQDMVAMQELIWQVRPDLIVETGIAHGGSLILSASMLALLDYADAVERGETLDPRNPRRKVLGIDIDIRPHNRAAIEAHPMAGRIEMIEGSSVAPETVERVRAAAARLAQGGTVLVCLDSNHTHAHVLAELEAYAPLVTPGSYCVVFDTVVEDLPAGYFTDRPWDRGDNPKTAVHAFLEANEDFEIDRAIERKLQITTAPDGYLRRR
ncbi:cephalosporin hydroxylase family protein [Aquibium sp. A9E412]|uniref:cephalosporin hydroxylase family protein n=1 Tax=Aquibium sp. A9E412 TaxID=2976767 RepID=UPI0025B110FC|nr:cephalosporin hydroxylase family protein [Aquibium sp. A9E412]MDN2566902.1 cephalosporin hydroxylase family protein [Aquibium sp. A9E412]